MGWANALVLVCLLAAGLIGLVLYIEARRQNRQVIKYRDVNQPGCFQIGKDIK